MKREPKTATAVIAPKQAEAMLERNRDDNRKISQVKVDQYKKAMVEGRWQLNGEPIKFDWNGDLLDGQHRLWACVEAGVPFTTLIVTDLPPDTFKTIDTGLGRNAGTILGIAGVPKSNYAAGAVKWILGIQAGKVMTKTGVTHMRLAPDEILAALDKMPRLNESIDIGLQTYKVVGFATVMSALHYIFAQYDREEANKFMADLREGVGLGANDPVWKLRERLMQRVARRTKPQEAYILTVRAWNARLEGRTISKMTLARASKQATSVSSRISSSKKDEPLPMELGVAEMVE